MTINGAIMELVMLCEHPMMPNYFKPSIQKVIETISEAELVEPKDEPQTDCNGCRYFGHDELEACGYCRHGDLYEPQTDCPWK